MKGDNQKTRERGEEKTLPPNQDKKGESEEEEGEQRRRRNKLISKTKQNQTKPTNKQVVDTPAVAEVRHGYMPVLGQEALIVPPRGVQVGPGAVRGVITPSSLVQHGDGGSGGVVESSWGGVGVVGAAPDRCEGEVMEKQERWRGREGGSGGMSEENKLWLLGGD